MFTRERHRRGVVYFGPYASAKKVRETLDVLNRVFPYRPCEGPQPGRHSGIPCLDYHIDRCLAPCVGYVTKEDYREIVDRVIEFLSGETRPVLRELEEKMRAAAARQEFEEAARYRNRLTAVRHLAERQAADKRAIGTVDVIGIAARGGRPPSRSSRFAAGGSSTAHVLPGERGRRGRPAAPRVVLPRVLRRRAERPAADRGAAGRRPDDGSRATCPTCAAPRSRCRPPAAWGEAAPPGARPAERRAGARERRRQPRAQAPSPIEALEELRECLNLESLPIRIECFDISTIQGESPVGSMVVFQDAVPKKAHYRKFGIKGVEGQDDFAMMAEVISRRFARAKEVTAERYDEGFAAIPNLVVVDGGKGQLGGARGDPGLRPPAGRGDRAGQARGGGLRPGPLAADGARPRLGGPPAPAADPDEAHRFALGFHRRRRDAKAGSRSSTRFPESARRASAR